VVVDGGGAVAGGGEAVEYAAGAAVGADKVMGRAG
jgi:hypothetical protein